MIDRVLEPHVVPLIGDLTVRRVLPRGGRGVGPFIFLDHMGPWQFEPGKTKADVLPHPHIGLSTLAYLFEGETLHRDSLGSVQSIQPGAVNWMTAGKGIAHSERVPEHLKLSPHRSHGLQAWVALPEHEEDRDPSFEHHPKETIPRHEGGPAGVKVTLIAGEALGLRSPVKTHSRLFYFHVEAERTEGSFLFDPEGQECAFYLISGSVQVRDEGPDEAAWKIFSSPVLLIFKPDAKAEIRASSAFSGVFLGGDSLGKRFISWNLVSSSQAKIDAAKQRWKDQQFDKIPGETEYIPWPN